MKNILYGMVLIVLVLFSATTYAEEWVPWGLASHPATVNPVAQSPLQKVLSLRGEWTFYPDIPLFRLSMGEAIWSSDWINNAKDKRTINVPGNWESQGIGQPGEGHTWDCVWDRGFWQIRHVFMGCAVYRKIIDVPDDWQGKQIWLKVGGVRSEAYIWVNTKRAAYINNYCGTEKFNITPFVKKGKPIEILAFVRNDVPSHKGLLAINHQFGGFYRDVELEATPDVWIDDAWVRGRFDQKEAEVHVKLDAVDTAKSEKSKVSVSAVIKTKEGKQVAQKSMETTLSTDGELVLNIPIPDCKPWTPESPHLYYAELSVTQAGNSKAGHGVVERFGVRKFEVRGNRFFLNDKPYFLRGGGDHNYDVMTIIPLPNRETFIEHMKLYKAAGFNSMRHHTHCPFPEYFEAADEIGFLLQPELPYYHDVPTEGVVPDPMRDLKELYQNYRRYTSFGIYSLGNEGWFGSPRDRQIYQWVKKNDPDRPLLHQDGGKNNPDNSDFMTGPIRPWQPGTLSPEAQSRPIVAHEYLNLSIKLDPKTEPQFTGIRFAPVTMKQYTDELKAAGLDQTWGDACIEAAQRLQGYYQKQGLEAARLDPVCDGYYYWSIIDASIPQWNSCVSQGWLDPFWHTKPAGLSAKDFYRFNGPTAVLFKPDQKSFVAQSGENVSGTVFLSHFGAETLPAGTVNARLVVKDTSRVLAQTSFKTKEIPAGFANDLGKISFPIPKLDQPVHVVLEVVIQGTAHENSWDFWLFPQREKKSLAGCVVSPSLKSFFDKHYTDVKVYGDKGTSAGDLLVISQQDEDLLVQGVQEGRRVFVIQPASTEPDVALGWWSLGTQVGTTFADHAVYGNFPKGKSLDPLWFRLIRRGAHDLKTKLPMGRLEPLAVGEGASTYFLYLGQTKIKKAKVLMSFAIALLEDQPESLALLDNMIDYAKSDKFEPKIQGSMALFEEKVPQGTILGYKKIISTDPETSTWFTWHEDFSAQYICRQNKPNSLVWRTAQTPQTDSTVTFIWSGGLGYATEPETEGFCLTLNGKDLIRFDVPSDEKDTTWKSEDGSCLLRFETKKQVGPDRSGLFYLTVPQARIHANAPQELGVRSLGSGSLRWFALYSYRNLE